MKTLPTLLLLCLTTAAFSQYYHREVGARGGYSAGLTFRVNIAEDLSYEAQMIYRNQGAIVSLIRQKHKPISMTLHGNWEFVYGLGAQAGFYFTDSYRVFFREIYYPRQLFTPVAGLTGYIGVDYVMENIPLSVGASFQPHMELSMRQVFGINLWDFGLHARYRF